MELTAERKLELWDEWKRLAAARDDNWRAMRCLPEHRRKPYLKRDGELGRRLFAISEEVRPAGLNFNLRGPRIVRVRRRG